MEPAYLHRSNTKPPTTYELQNSHVSPYTWGAHVTPTAARIAASDPMDLVELSGVLAIVAASIVTVWKKIAGA